MSDTERPPEATLVNMNAGAAKATAAPSGGDSASQSVDDRIAGLIAADKARAEAASVHQPLPGIGNYQLGSSLAASPLAHATSTGGRGDMRDYQAKVKKETFVGYPIVSLGVRFTGGSLSLLEASLAPAKCTAVIADLNKKWGAPSVGGPGVANIWSFDKGALVSVISASQECRVRISR